MLLTLLTGCGAGSDQAKPAALPSALTAQLQAELFRQLAALGKDPARTASAAPQGDDNAVFDLAAQLLDANGQPLPPGQPAVNGLRLEWTERLSGDYDQNGEVNAADIGPLALHYKALVQYDDAHSHGGVAYWPAGDPDGAGAANWRRARIDGDSNTEINQADIQPIAQHFKEHMGGYRVYRQGPNETSFTRMLDPDDAASPFTVTKLPAPQPSQLVPLRYSFTDPQARLGGLGPGVYHYYVAAHDSASQQDGPACATLDVDIVAGTVNHAPVAKLKVTPTFTGAPAVVTLDAALSYDVDGTVASYSWDVDGDGVVDYTSTDPVPDPATKSSGGTVDHLVPVGANQLTAQFHQGSTSYLHPRVTVTDNSGAASAPGSAQLGLTGWELQWLNEDPHNYKLLMEDIDLISSNPDTGQLVAIGHGDPNYSDHQQIVGTYFGFRNPDGSWTEELMQDELGGDWAKQPPTFHGDGTPVTYGGVYPLGIFWRNGQPLVVLFSGEDKGHSGSYMRTWAYQRHAGGGWTRTLGWEGTDEPTEVDSGGSMKNSVMLPDQRLLTLGSESIGKAPPDPDRRSRIYGLFDDTTPWRPVFTGLEQQELGDGDPGLVALDVNSQPLFLMGRRPGSKAGMWGARLQDAGGLIEERLDDGSIPVSTQYYSPLQAVLDNLGRLIVEYRVEPPAQNYPIYEFGPGKTVVRTIGPGASGSAVARVDGLHSSQFGYGVFVYRPLPVTELHHLRVEGGQETEEMIFPDESATYSSAAFQCDTVDAQQRLWGVVSLGFTHHQNYLARHLDPRQGGN